MVRGDPQNSHEARLYISKLVLATVFAVRQYQDAVRVALPAPAHLREDSLTAKLKEVGVISRDYAVAVTRTDNLLMLQTETGLVGVERETTEGQMDKSYHVIDVYNPVRNLDVRCYVFGDVLQGESLEYVVREQDVVFEPKIVKQQSSGSGSRVQIQADDSDVEKVVKYHFDKSEPRELSLKPIARTNTNPSNITFRDGTVELGKVVRFSLGQQLGKSWVDGIIPSWAFYHVREIRENVVELSVYLPNHQ